jgi:hypothetical protein
MHATVAAARSWPLKLAALRAGIGATGTAGDGASTASSDSSRVRTGQSRMTLRTPEVRGTRCTRTHTHANRAQPSQTSRKPSLSFSLSPSLSLSLCVSFSLYLSLFLSVSLSLSLYHSLPFTHRYPAPHSSGCARSTYTHTHTHTHSLCLSLSISLSLSPTLSSFHTQVSSATLKWLRTFDMHARLLEQLRDLKHRARGATGRGLFSGGPGSFHTASRQIPGMLGGCWVVVG